MVFSRVMLISGFEVRAESPLAPNQVDCWLNGTEKRCCALDTLCLDSIKLIAGPVIYTGKSSIMQLH